MEIVIIKKGRKCLTYLNLTSCKRKHQYRDVKNRAFISEWVEELLISFYLQFPSRTCGLCPLFDTVQQGRYSIWAELSWYCNIVIFWICNVFSIIYIHVLYFLVTNYIIVIDFQSTPAMISFNILMRLNKQIRKVLIRILHGFAVAWIL